MKIGVLTSSRADYGIYKPLLIKLSNDDRFELIIIAFGMHLQHQHGKTLEAIQKDNFGEIHEVSGMSTDDNPIDIVKGYGQVIIEFAEYWNNNKFNCVLALGDRFEMSAAVQAGIPFRVNFAHLHGGETTLGAIDNIYRHQITLASKTHFVSTEEFIRKVEELTGNAENIYNVGALSLDGIEKMTIPDWDDVRVKFQIPNESFVLTTFHPETVEVEKNKEYCKVIFNTLGSLCEKKHIIITLANADTMGSLYRDMAKKLKDVYPNNITLINSFGKENYFSAMKNCQLLVGNTSSGILEAASFGKYVINVGERQAGRLRSKNVIDVSFDKEDIEKAFEKIKDKEFIGKNEYYKTNTANKIIEILTVNAGI